MSGSSSRTTLRTIAGTLAVGLGLLAAAPATAAAPVAKGTASAVQLSVAGNSAYSGSYSATNDGTTQTTTGDNQPPITVLGSNKLVKAGVLAQDAATSVSSKGVGTARACAGLAGNGATVVGVGRSSCLTPGDNLTLTDSSFDFSDLDPGTGLVDSAANATLLAALEQAGLTSAAAKALIAPLATGLNGPIKQFFDSLGSPSITAGIGVVEAQCTATDGSASGAAQLADAGLKVSFGSVANNAGIKDIAVTLPEHPAPNTRVVTDLGSVTKQLTDALAADLKNNANSLPGLSAVLTALGGGVSQADVINGIVAQLSSNLKPLQDNVLDVVLNEQSRSGDSQIHVTALDGRILPAATASLGAPLADLRIGDVTCRAGSAAAVSPSGTVPTTIDSGIGGDAGNDGVVRALGVLMLLGGAALGLRRLAGSGD